MQTRTTTPDRFSLGVKLAFVLMRAGVITPGAFSRRITKIWANRHA